MPTCAMPGCFHRPPSKDRYRQDPPDGVSFHHVPVAEERRAAWSHFVGRDLSPDAIICSIHFPPDSFDHGFLTRLKPDAVPSLHQDLNRVKRVRLDHNYALPTARELKCRLDLLSDHVQELNRKVNTQTQCIGRLQKRMASLQEVIQELESHGLVSDKASEILSTFDTLPGQIFERFLKNCDTAHVSGAEYPAEIRAFAFTLHFYSAKAYRYVRDTFGLALPHEKTVSSWYSSIKSEPGFSEESYRILKARVAEKREINSRVYVSLMCDELHIASRQEWDSTIQAFRGCVDLGPGAQKDNGVLATSCLVFMAVCVNEGWKIPLGYFFIHGLSGKERANLCRIAIERLEELDVTTICLVCDGPHGNQTMLRELGACLDPDDIQPFFTTDRNNRVYILLDICHMLKLTRNFFEREQSFVDGQGRTVSWQFLVKLADLQKSEGLQCANKLTHRHINFQQQKMNVRLGAQLMSSSVASAIEFCDKELHLPQFKDSEGTVAFLRLFDQLFDLFNSRNPCASNFKAPMRHSNQCFWRPFMKEASLYILGLRNAQGKPVVKTQGRTPFVGFLVAIASFDGIFNDYVLSKRLNYILTYKFSQDHLELFFASIRSGLGSNDNPSCREFVSLFKRLLVRHEVKTVNGSAIPLDDTVLLHVSSKKKATIQIDAQDIGLLKTLGQNASTEDVEVDLCALPATSMYKDAVVAYMAGYVVRMISRALKCPKCVGALTTDQPSNTPDYALIKFRDNGGLLYPSKSVLTICKTAERHMTLAEMNVAQMRERNALERHVKLPTIMDLLAFGSSIFQDLDDHEVDAAPLLGHKVRLVKAVIDAYCKIRIHHLAKKMSLASKSMSVRKKFTKLIHFKND